MSEPSTTSSERPGSVTLIAALLFIISVLGLLGAFNTLAGVRSDLATRVPADQVMPLFWTLLRGQLGMIVAVYLLAIALHATTAVGLFLMRRWAFWTYTVIFVLSLLAMLAARFSPAAVGVAVIEAAVFWYLYTVKKFLR